MTGGSSGIGLAVVRRLLEEGAEVTAVARRPVEAVASKGANAPLGMTTVRCDLTKFDELQAVMKKLMSANAALDGAVLCHGYGDFGHFEEFSAERIIKLVNANLLSHMLVARHVVPVLKRRGRGDIVFIGSESGIRAGKMGAVYSAAKHAINGFAESLRAEGAAANLRVSVINPGAVETAFFDHLDFRPGDARANYIEPDDVAQIVSAILRMPQGTVIDKVNLTPQKRVMQKK